jgi:hypothetical protein
MSGWKPSALYGLVVSFVPLLFFAIFALLIGPAFAKTFADFGAVPLPARLAVHPATPVAVIGFLVAGIVGGAMRPRERFVILPLVAAAGIVLAFAAMAALYLPLFSLASEIR